MLKRKKYGPAVASVSMVAALASPTFGTLSFIAGESTVVVLHDAEDADAGGVSPTNFRTTSPNPLSISATPATTPATYQLAQAQVNQFGTSTAGNSTARLGVGQFFDTRSATMTIKSGSFVNQNEVNTDAGLKMDGNSLLSTNFSLVWQNSGTVYGPNIVGRMSIPVQATIVGGGSARVQLTNVQWEVDRAATTGDNYFDARPAYTGELAFTSAGTFSSTLTSNSIILKDESGATGLTLGSGDKLRLSGTLTFLADGNSPADIFVGTDYQSLVLSKNPLRYYRFEETSTTQNADDIGSNDADGNYRGDITLNQTSAPGLGNAAHFSSSNIITFVEDLSLASAATSADVQAGTSGLTLENGPFSIEAWVNKSEFFGNYFNDGPSDEFRAIVDNQTPSGNGVTLGMLDDAIIFGGETDLIVPFNSTVGEFYHIVVVTDGLGNGTVYVNGIAVGTGAYDLGNGGASFLIGNAGNDLDTQFVGLIDEVAIYKTALSSYDINLHFQNGGQNGDVLPLMGVELNELFVEAMPEPATATMALVMAAAGSATMGRRRRA